MTLLRTSARHRPRPLALALAWVLVAALLLAQGLGLVHAVRHAPGLAHAANAAHTHGAAPAMQADAGADSFGGHAGQDAASCQLYDQLTHADLLPAALLPPLAVAGAAVVAALPPTGRLPRCSTAYSARAPPRG